MTAPRIAEVDSDTTRPLRLAVLRGNDPTYSAAPGDAPGAVHLAAYDGSTVIGSAVLIPEPCPLWPDVPAVRLRGMAVAPDHQGTGVGTLVLDAAFERARATGLLWCNARTSAQRFYERAGLQAEGDVFVTKDTGVEHVLMWRKVG